MFKTMSYTNIRRNLKSSFDEVCEEHNPLLVTRRNGGNVIILSQEDYEAMEETAYLLRSPANAKRLIDAKNRKSGFTLQEVKNALNL